MKHISLLLTLPGAGCTDHPVLDPLTANCRLTEINGVFINGIKTTFEYNANGRVNRMVRKFDDQFGVITYDYRFTHDANGVLINRLISSMDGQDKFFEAKLTYNGGSIRKTAFSLMPQAGLPVDPILARQWESVYPENGAVLSYYEADPTGTLQLFAQGTIKDMTVNQSGGITGWSYGDVTGDLTPVKFTVTGCP